MKKVLILCCIISVSTFAQSKFAIEAGGGIDLVTDNNHSANYDNGFSLMISPIYNFNETFSFMATFAFHRVEGYQYYNGPILLEGANYSIDDPNKPNIKTYDFSIGMRTNFSEKKITPYFVIRTGLLFTETPRYYFPLPYYLPYQKNDETIAYYLSPGLGVNFRLISNLSVLIEGRFMITTGNEYSYLPLTTSVIYNF
jgi:Outer membrane protein beta-barrel domain